MSDDRPGPRALSAASKAARSNAAQSGREVSRDPAPTQQLVRRVAFGTVLGGLVFAALALYGDVRAITSSLSRFAWGTFPLALLLSSSNYALRFIRWQHYLRLLGVSLPAGESALVFLAGFVMSVTPGKLGEVLKSFLLFSSRKISIARTAPVVLAERLTDLSALVVLTVLGSLAFDEGRAIAVAAGALVTFLLAATGCRPLGEALLTLAGRVPGVRRIAPRLREAYDALAALVRPAPLVLATALATLSWGLECVALWLLVGGFEGASIALPAASLAYSAATVAGALAMLPGGLGVTEAGMTGLLQMLGEGVTPAVASSATLLVRLATLWWAVAVGLVAFALLRARSGHAPDRAGGPRVA
jgi:uncharacterized membrane protein YbhN (UPF0104 family)